jgi:hypothetical protein
VNKLCLQLHGTTCRFCGARLKQDSVGHYCPTKNCQYQHGVKECPVREGAQHGIPGQLYCPECQPKDPPANDAGTLTEFQRNEIIRLASYPNNGDTVAEYVETLLRADSQPTTSADAPYRCDGTGQNQVSSNNPPHSAREQARQPEVWLEKNGYPQLEQIFERFVDGPITRSRLNALLSPLLESYALSIAAKARLEEAKWWQTMKCGTVKHSPKYCLCCGRIGQLEREAAQQLGASQKES